LPEVRLQGRGQTDVRRRRATPWDSYRFRWFQGTGLQAFRLIDLVFFLGSRKKSKAHSALPIARVSMNRIPEARPQWTVSSIL